MSSRWTHSRFVGPMMTSANVTWTAVGVRSSWGDADDLRWLRNSEFSPIWKITRLFSPRTALVFHIFFLHRNTHLLQIFKISQLNITFTEVKFVWIISWVDEMCIEQERTTVERKFSFHLREKLCNNVIVSFWLMSELEISVWFKVMGGCAHWMTELGRRCWLSHRSNFWDEFQNFYDVRQNVPAKK